MHRRNLFVIFSLIAVVIACSKRDINRFIGFDTPAGFPQPVYHFKHQPGNTKGV